MLTNYKGYTLETFEGYCSLCSKEIYLFHGGFTNEFYEDHRKSRTNDGFISRRLK